MVSLGLRSSGRLLVLREPALALADSFLVHWGLLCCYVFSCLEQTFHLIGESTDRNILLLWSHAQGMSVL